MINLNVFQGEVNQLNDVAGRLEEGRGGEISTGPQALFHPYLGGSSTGFMLGSSRALAAGRS